MQALDTSKPVVFENAKEADQTETIVYLTDFVDTEGRKTLLFKAVAKDSGFSTPVFTDCFGNILEFVKGRLINMPEKEWKIELMQELDVSKPMMFRSEYREDTVNIKYISDYIDLNKKECRIFLVTYKNGTQSVFERYKNGCIAINTEYEDDIINVPEPEKPAFSWDKPVRFTPESQHYNNKIISHKICADNCIEVLIEFFDKSRLWHHYNHSDVHIYLENYEPEEKYEIGTNPATYFKYKLNNKEDKEAIAGFVYKDDAELFKSAKERGL